MVLIARAAEPTLPGWLGFTMMKRTRENTAGEPVSGARRPLRKRAIYRPGRFADEIFLSHLKWRVWLGAFLMFSGRYPSVGAARREAADGLSHRIRTEFYAPDAQHRHQGGPACRHHHQPCQPGFGTPERGSQGAARLCHGSRPRRRGVHRRDVARRLPGPRGPGREFGLQGPDQAEFQWIIDPLDGTTNFIHGLPNYAVSIALTQRGRSRRRASTIRRATNYSPPAVAAAP